MVEEFIGIIAATIIVMRPCFHMVFTTVSGRTSTLFSTKKSSSGVTSESYGVEGDRGSKGFKQIVRTTEIEMNTRNRTTEDEIEVLPREIFGHGF
jgi:hypothetical protein